MDNVFDVVNIVLQIILAFGVYIVFLQLKTQIREARYDRTLQQLKKFEDTEFMKIRIFVLKEWDGNFPLNENDELKIREFAHKMEIFGALYLKKYIDRNFVRDMYGPFIVYAWYRCKPFIEKEKSERELKKYHEHFRIMHLHVMELFNKKYPENIIKIPNNAFIKSEQNNN